MACVTSTTSATWGSSPTALVLAPPPDQAISSRVVATAYTAAGMVTKGYNAKYTGPVPGLSVVWFNAARVLHEALKKANSLDVDKVRDALENLGGTPTVFGPVRWTGKERYGINHQLLHSFLISEIKDGKVTLKARVEAGP